MKTVVAKMIMLSLMGGLLGGMAMGQPPIPPQEQPEVLTRGPVHEAFSEPVILQIQAGLVVPEQPPDDIDEIPPDEMPQGDNIVWVPGYWSWDGDRNNYIWVSGCWRAAPPNMSWVPGYWSQENDGWEWVAGFWTPSDSQEIQYLPAPPESYDTQPSNSPPSPNDIWVPSCQYWQQDHYVDRPGYWLMANLDWVWTPSHYVWTPRGYIFCDGHWDYPLEDRGMLFAPVYFPPSVYGRVNYSYSPIIVVDLGAMVANLFTYPRYNHYYFGDYYDDAYLRVGIYPRYQVDVFHTWYDPTYVYDRWHHRDQPRWVDNGRQEYDSRHTNKDLRPPRTYHDMETRLATKSPDQQQENVRMAEPLSAVVANKATPIKYQHIDPKEQQNIATQATAVHTYKAERNRWESKQVSEPTAQPPTERKGAVLPPSKTPPSNMPPSKTPPSRQKEPMTPTKQIEPVKSPHQQKEQVTQPGENKPQFVPPAKVNMTQPERVKVPAPPIVGKQTPAEKSPPPQPVNERKYKNDVKDTPKNNQGIGTSKDTGNPKGTGDTKDKSNTKNKSNTRNKGKK